ncbi:hypothetical protein MTO96_048403 [Rhipicephalus appendiculatus]
MRPYSEHAAAAARWWLPPTSRRRPRDSRPLDVGRVLIWASPLSPRIKLTPLHPVAGQRYAGTATTTTTAPGETVVCYGSPHTAQGDDGDAALLATPTPDGSDALKVRPPPALAVADPEYASTQTSPARGDATSARRRASAAAARGGVSKMALLFYTLYGFAIIFFAGWWFVWLLHLLAIFNG